jgi:hypothetical protein
MARADGRSSASGHDPAAASLAPRTTDRASPWLSGARLWVWLTWLTGRSDAVGYALSGACSRRARCRPRRARSAAHASRLLGLIDEDVRRPGARAVRCRVHQTRARHRLHPRMPSAPIPDRGRWQGHRVWPSFGRRNVAALLGEGARHSGAGQAGPRWPERGIPSSHRYRFAGGAPSGRPTRAEAASGTWPFGLQGPYGGEAPPLGRAAQRAFPLPRGACS